jgi:hypothetical protein
MEFEMDPSPLALLNRILSVSAPDALLCLPKAQAIMLGQLTARELGDELKSRMSTTSVTHALQAYGLFGRRVLVVSDQKDFSVNCQK